MMGRRKRLSAALALLVVVAAIGGGARAADPAPGEGEGDSWPQFRGPRRDGIDHGAKGLYRSWPASGPKVLWKIEGIGQGYAGPAVFAGKVYFHDYDEAKSLWIVRCVRLADGQELWRWSYERAIRAYHSITRTVPAVDAKYVVSLDPKCVLHCLDAAKGERTGQGEELWVKDLPKEFGVTIPQWYNGQCPLNEPDRVIVALAGKELLMAAIDKATGKLLWQTPNVSGHRMAHPSVTPMTLAGRKQYVWCTLKGMVGVDAADGKLLWEHLWAAADQPGWRPTVAIAPSPVQVGEDRVFMTSSYDAGSVMLKIDKNGEAWSAKELYTLTSKQFASDCHTPILWKDRLFAVNGERFSCMDFDGKIVWAGPEGVKFGLGNFILADGMFFILEGDSGKLRLVEASTEGYKELASAQLLSGHDVWAPMALIGGKLLLRDLRTLICVEVGPSEGPPRQ